MINTPYDQAGAHERHLLRKSNNPLFGCPIYTSEDLETARLNDQNELADFTIEVQQLVMSCLQMGDSAETDEVLRLKEKLDLLYERSCGLAGDLSNEQMAIQSVIHPIMIAIEKSAATDPKALKTLNDERQARQLHIELLNNKLVCDLLRPDTTIEQTELTATLLSEPAETIIPVLDFFDLEQITHLQIQGQQLLEQLCLEADHTAHQSLRAIEQNIKQRGAAQPSRY